MTKSFKFLTAGVAMFALAGCASRRLSQGSAQYMPPPPPPGIAYPPPGAVIVRPGQVPPGAVSQGSAPAGFPTAPTQPAPGAPPFPTSPQPGPTSQFPVAPQNAQPSPPAASIPVDARDRVSFRWEPASPPAAGSSPSTPPSSDPLRPNVLLLPPAPDTSAEPKELRKSIETPEPPRASQLPVGIAGFDRVRENLTTGQRPSLEGLDWLQKSGVKIVVFLHRPGEPLDGDRQQVEKRGMTFVPIEINPQGLAPESVDRFMKLQTENRADMRFVYDLDGSLAGAMWYLSYRLIDQDSDEVARIKAGSLGQPETREAARDVWQAARKFADSR